MKTSKLTYKQAWEKLFNQLSANDQQLVLNSPDGKASANLALRAHELSEEVDPRFVLKRDSDGWYLGHGGHYESNPDKAIRLDSSDVEEWLAEHRDHSAIKFVDAREIE